MGRKTFLYLFTLLFFACFGISEASADGLLLAEPGSIPGSVEAPAALSVKKHLVTVRIESQVATTRVDQVFVNGSKIGYLRGGAWVDSSYREGMKTTNLLPFSGAYFELLKRAPELAKCLAVSKNLVVVHGSTCYRISD